MQTLEKKSDKYYILIHVWCAFISNYAVIKQPFLQNWTNYFNALTSEGMAKLQVQWLKKRPVGKFLGKFL